MMSHSIDTGALDSILVGRVDPHIYAFTTGTVPNYLKVGDTYRPVNTRLEEWRKYYPDLVEQDSYSAKLEDGMIFRDYSVHNYLMDECHRERLQPEELQDGVYYSREFFKEATAGDVQAAISDIHDSYNAKDGRYNFYTSEHLPVELSYKRDQEPLELRPNQKKVLENFSNAIQKGRTNLLMFAVMRFGKSFTAMSCALEMHARLVLVVSAKADVMEGWKKTVEKPKQFEEYVFLHKETLDRNERAISDTLDSGKKVVVFLTLQDLQGNEVKNRHKELFSSPVDLLIIDETHFGARAEQYGKVLQDAGLMKKQIAGEMYDYDEDTFQHEIKVLKARVRLHLSGTPYRILMGDEFEQEDIISFCQFPDIVEAQHQWDLDNLFAEKGTADTEVNEWDNPYYGFPQMIRFAFNPSASALEKLKELKSNGCTYAFSELFRPQSLVRDKASKYCNFKHSAEILDMFEAIDGSKSDGNILPFLNYEKIKRGKMCRHIVCVLPFKASCDALEKLLEKNRDKFKNLNAYTIVNIAGLNSESSFPTVCSVKSFIEKCENENHKTLTLTVNRMLTGTTVEQWDTMLYFKDTASPQEYDQAIFRLQNQYIKTYINDDKVIKYNMKPQTLVVDFDPARVFRLQELKSLFYMTNVNQRGNDLLEDRIEKELAISPIFVVNQNKMIEMTSSNIIEEVINYSKDKSILDEALEIPVDNVLLEIEEIKNLISSLKPIDSKKGLEISTGENDPKTDLDLPKPVPQSSDEPAPESGERPDSVAETDDEKELGKKLVAYYTRILFYSFLTDSKVISLSQVIDSISDSVENQRIAQHVSIKVSDLKLIFENASHFKLSQLDGSIHKINLLGKDESMTPIERAHVAMKKFARISDSEVVTPVNVADDLVSFIPADQLDRNFVILDLASKQGEIACAIYNKYAATKPEILDNVYSVATSGLTYELTKKIYDSLGMPTDHILNFTSFALLGDDAEAQISKLVEIHPSAVIAAPPYQMTDGGGRGEGGSAIYHRFFDIAKNIGPRYIAMYLKANWYSGGRGDGLADFRSYMLTCNHIKTFHDYPDATTYINSPVTIRGGVCTFLWDSEHEGPADFYNHINKTINYRKRNVGIDGIDILIRYNEGIDILSKVLSRCDSFIKEKSFHRNLFHIASNSDVLREIGGTDCFKVYLPKNKIGYISKNDMDRYEELKEYIDSWKVIVAKASPGTDKLPHSVISQPILAEPGSVCTDSHLVVSMVHDEEEGKALIEYMKTPFFRSMMLLAKNNQNMNLEIFRFVPNIRYSPDMDLLGKFDITEYQSFIETVIKPVNSAD